MEISFHFPPIIQIMHFITKIFSVSSATATSPPAPAASTPTSPPPAAETGWWSRNPTGKYLSHGENWPWYRAWCSDVFYRIIEHIKKQTQNLIHCINKHTSLLLQIFFIYLIIKIVCEFIFLNFNFFLVHLSCCSCFEADYLLRRLRKWFERHISVLTQHSYE